MVRYRTSTRRQWLRRGTALGLVGLSGCLNPFADSTGIEFPPGLSADGVDDPDALLEAHREAVTASSFTGEYDRQLAVDVPEVDDSRESPVTMDAFDIRAEPSAERVVRSRRGGSPTPSLERMVYIDGDYRATDYPGPLTQESAADLIEDSLEPIGDWLLEAVAEYRGTRSNETDPLHEYRLSGIDSDLIPRGFPDGETDGDGLVLVDETGRIHRYRTTQSGQNDEITMELRIEFEFGEFGETTVEEPPGVDAVGPDGHQVIEPGTRIELEARNDWVAVAPPKIEGFENPPFALEAGESYEIGWTTGDGRTHNLEIVDADGTVVGDLATERIHGEDGEQWFEFTASEEMAAYNCGPDGATGTIAVY
ncbi:plastocyanin [Natrinema sp. H-ect4]|uniref:plastocyanin n=1 Tax=Natrinema sp. H-ect4 TaxID=3242699 RepID=UPI0035A8DA37